MKAYGLALCLCVLAIASATATEGITPVVSAARVIRLAVTPPGKDGRTSVVATHENESLSVSVPNLGTFSFTPSVQSDNQTVLVTIFDDRNEGHQRLGEVRALIGGKVVQSKTTPSFGIKVVSVSGGTSTEGSR